MQIPGTLRVHKVRRGTCPRANCKSCLLIEQSRRACAPSRFSADARWWLHAFTSPTPAPAPCPGSPLPSTQPSLPTMSQQILILELPISSCFLWFLFRATPGRPVGVKSKLPHPLGVEKLEGCVATLSFISLPNSGIVQLALR